MTLKKMWCLLVLIAVLLPVKGFPEVTSRIQGTVKDFSTGETQFSLSGLYLISDNLYAGIEYNAWMMYDAFDEPFHTITGLIGYQF